MGKDLYTTLPLIRKLSAIHSRDLVINIYRFVGLVLHLMQRQEARIGKWLGKMTRAVRPTKRVSIQTAFLEKKVTGGGLDNGAENRIYLLSFWANKSGLSPWANVMFNAWNGLTPLLHSRNNKARSACLQLIVEMRSTGWTYNFREERQ